MFMAMVAGLGRGDVTPSAVDLGEHQRRSWKRERECQPNHKRHFRGHQNPGACFRRLHYRRREQRDDYVVCGTFVFPHRRGV
jgi:hypothetical protein